MFSKIKCSLFETETFPLIDEIGETIFKSDLENRMTGNSKVMDEGKQKVNHLKNVAVSKIC